MDFDAGVDRIEASGLSEDDLAGRTTQLGEHLYTDLPDGAPTPSPQLDLYRSRPVSSWTTLEEIMGHDVSI